MILHAFWPCLYDISFSTLIVLIRIYRWQLCAQNCAIGRERIELTRPFIGETHNVSRDFHKNINYLTHDFFSRNIN